MHYGEITADMNLWMFGPIPLCAPQCSSWRVSTGDQWCQGPPPTTNHGLHADEKAWWWQSQEERFWYSLWEVWSKQEWWVGKCGWAFPFTSGSMYVKDYVRELERLNIPIDQLELDELNRISDSTGKVCSPSKSECRLTCFPTDWKSWLREAFSSFCIIQGAGQE